MFSNESSYSEALSDMQISGDRTIEVEIGSKAEARRLRMPSSSVSAPPGGLAARRAPSSSIHGRHYVMNRKHMQEC